MLTIKTLIRQHYPSIWISIDRNRHCCLLSKQGLFPLLCANERLIARARKSVIDWLLQIIFIIRNLFKNKRVKLRN